jgi:hypothetical protein
MVKRCQTVKSIVFETIVGWDYGSYGTIKGTSFSIPTLIYS